MEHTLSVTKLCDYYCSAYPILQRDLLLTAAMCHDIGKVKEASVTELCEADGITENVAEEIYRFFHEDTSKKNGDVV